MPRGHVGIRPEDESFLTRVHGLLEFDWGYCYVMAVRLAGFGVMLTQRVSLDS